VFMGLFGDSNLVSPAGIRREGRGGLLSASIPLGAFSFVLCAIVGLNKSDPGGKMEKLSLLLFDEEENNSLRRLLRGFSLTGEGVVDSRVGGMLIFSRPRDFRVIVRFIGAADKLEPG
jgi:hypothetical protein